MTNATDIAPQLNTKEIAARGGWAVLICATLYVCYFSHLGAIGFVGPDEPRYAWIARDMAETGDWVTPRLYGKPWFEKPPLYYWGAAVCFKLFGVSEAAARLPSAICALLATLAMAWLAWRIYGSETARWVLLLLPTTVGMIGFSHAAATDMPFSAMLTVAMVCAAAVLGLVPPKSRGQAAPDASFSADRGTARSPWLALVLFGFFLGLAVLAKGPAGIILCGGAVFFWALFTKRWRAALRLLHPAAIATFCVTALPWYVLCARRNPDFFRIFIIDHNFNRYLTPEFQHIQPFWYYGPILCIALLPWTFAALILGVGAFAWRKDTWRISPRLFLLCWILLPIIFFTVSKSKLPGYVLPSVPPLGLLVACALPTREPEKLPQVRWICLLTGTAFLVIGVLVFMQLEWIDFGLVPLVFVCGGVAMLVVCVRPSLTPAISVGVATVVVVVALSFGWLTRRQLDQRFSARPALENAPLICNDSFPEHVSIYKLERAFHFSLNFYLHRELPNWSPDSGPQCVFASHTEAHNLRERGLKCPIVIKYAVIVCEDPGSAVHAAGGGKTE